MANSFLTPQQITNEMLRQFAARGGFGHKIGDTIHVRKPVRFSFEEELDFERRSRIHAERIAALRRRRTEWQYYLTFSRAA